MQIGNLIIEPWNRKNAIWRIIALSLLAAWIGWGVIIFQEGKAIDARIAAEKQEELNRQAIKRRKAILEREMQENRSAGSQNIVDTLPGGKL